MKMLEIKFLMVRRCGVGSTPRQARGWRVLLCITPAFHAGLLFSLTPLPMLRDRGYDNPEPVEGLNYALTRGKTPGKGIHITQPRACRGVERSLHILTLFQ